MATPRGGASPNEWCAPSTSDLAPTTGAPSADMQKDVPLVLRMLLGPLRQNLPRPDGVELVDAVEHMMPT
jgi:hypothetical protein